MQDSSHQSEEDIAPRHSSEMVKVHTHSRSNSRDNMLNGGSDGCHANIIPKETGKQKCSSHGNTNHCQATVDTKIKENGICLSSEDGMNIIVTGRDSCVCERDSDQSECKNCKNAISNDEQTESRNISNDTCVSNSSVIGGTNIYGTNNAASDTNTTDSQSDCSNMSSSQSEGRKIVNGEDHMQIAAMCRAIANQTIDSNETNSDPAVDEKTAKPRPDTSSLSLDVTPVKVGPNCSENDDSELKLQKPPSGRKKVKSRNPPGKQSWLLRLFESKLFDMSIAITYLFNSKEHGVQTYIGK